MDHFEKRQGIQGSTDCLFLQFLVLIFSMSTFFILVDRFQKVKHAWAHTQYCYNSESKSFELNIQYSWLLLKLSGLFNSDELSTVLETKAGEIQGPLKPEEFSQAFAKGLLHLQVVHLTWFIVLTFCCWFALGSACGTQSSRAKRLYPSKEAKSISALKRTWLRTVF